MSNIERSRRYRQRLKSGRAVFRIEAEEVALIEMLCSTGYLNPLAADDPEKVRAALERLVASLVAVDVHLA